MHELLHDFFFIFAGMDQDKVLKGYIHDVSHVGQGDAKKFFDFKVQTESEIVRGVCFSPGKKRTFDEMAANKSPVKIKKFMPDKNPHSSDILMNDAVVIEELQTLDFTYRSIIPQEMNIGKLSSLTPNQLLTLKAKVIKLQKPAEINQNSDNPLTKREGLLIDPHGTIKIVLWQNEVNAVENGETYLFKNLRLKKNRVSGDIYVNPAKGCASFLAADPFPEDSLHPPQEIPEELVTTTVMGEVIGVQKCSLSICCFKCSKPIELTSAKAAVVHCSHCDMKQKFSRCRKQWYINAVLNNGNTNFTVNFYNDSVRKVLEMAKPEEQETTDEQLVSDIFFELPTITCAFNNRTRAVESVEYSE